MLFKVMMVVVLSHSVLSDSWQPCGLQTARLLCPWNSPGKNTGMEKNTSPNVMISKQINKETKIAITMESRGEKSANDKDSKPAGLIVVNGVRSSSLRKDKNLPQAGG